MKTENRTNYIDRRGVPHGDWRRIVGYALAAWNEQRELEEIKSHREG